MIDTAEAVKVIEQNRNGAITVAVMVASIEWTRISKNPELDAIMTGTMGKASSVGLGLALAKPEHRVFILDADGSLLMNLGSLVTIANMAPANLVHFVFENTVYCSTGGQPVPNANKFNFAGLAKAAGYAHAYEFSEADEMAGNLGTILKLNGPIFICLKITPSFRRPDFPEHVEPDMMEKVRNLAFHKG